MPRQGHAVGGKVLFTLRLISHARRLYFTQLLTIDTYDYDRPWTTMANNGMMAEQVEQEEEERVDSFSGSQGRKRSQNADDLLQARYESAKMEWEQRRIHAHKCDADTSGPSGQTAVDAATGIGQADRNRTQAGKTSGAIAQGSIPLALPDALLAIDGLTERSATARETL